MKENQMSSLDKMEEEKMREAFIKTGMWPNEVMYANWCRAWKESAAYANSKHSAILEDYDRLAKLCEKQDREIQELRNKLNEMTERHTL